MEKYFAAALALMPLIAVAFAIGNIFSSFMNAVGRNPSAKDGLASYAIVGAALAEGVALFCLIIAWIILQGK